MASAVTLTNPDKVFWPDEGITKGELFEYYRAVSPALLPHVRGRPLTVKRYPNGIEGETFYQKNAPKGTPEWVRTITLPAESAKRDVAYVLCNDPRTLLWLGNLASIELHPWISRVDRLERPDWLVLDVDPPEGRFDLAVRTALVTNEVLEELRLPGCAKTSGSKGVHVYVPLQRRYGYDVVRRAGAMIAERVAEREPSLVTTDVKRATRGERVYLDFTRVGMGAHVVAVYSPRARPGAPVSFPVPWKDLERVDPGEFTLRTAPALIARRDPWPALCPPPQSLPRELR
ncbi:MAG: non-homologous end-joining DNA ligase [Actinomycetota bacterium]